MKLAALSLAEYSLPLNRPFPGARDACHERRGILIGLESESGKMGWGDVAPLPGFSPETLAQARQELRDDTAFWARLSGAVVAAESVDQLLGATAGMILSASTRFGIETAMLNLWAVEQGSAWHRALVPEPLARIQVNALLAGDDLVAAAGECLEAGFSSIKVKVGVKAPEQDGEDVAALLAFVAKRASIRLDANRAWTLDAALRFSAAVGACDIDYIEEPLSEPDALPRFAAETHLPLALDESLSDAALDRGGLGAKAWVIKPGLQDGISGTLKLCAAARACGAVPVISALFESGVGLRALAQLAAAVGDAHVPVGLDTGKWLAADVIEPAFGFTRGYVDVEQLAAQSVETVID